MRGQQRLPIFVYNIIYNIVYNIIADTRARNNISLPRQKPKAMKHLWEFSLLPVICGRKLEICIVCGKILTNQSLSPKK